MRKIIILSLFIFSNSFFAQKNYPDNYFGQPLEIKSILSGTFAELRSNHFHSGIDIKTNQIEGLNVLATADGYVSRIKVSPWGYGKALYIKHPNGYTTVYGHLKKFSPEIEEYVKKEQYRTEKFEVELFPKKNELTVFKKQLIAFSGNTGGSGGPHLHYEIRDINQHPINPMLFGYKIKDTSKPNVNAIYAYSINDTSQVNNHNDRIKLRLTKNKDGNYIAETIYAHGIIGIGINSYDKQDLAHNKNGVYNIKTYINGSLNYELAFEKFSFNETRHLNELIDYAYYKKNKSRIQKLFKNENNPLSIIKNTNDLGRITINDGENINYKIEVSDFNKNTRSIIIPINGRKNNITHLKKEKEIDYYIYHDSDLNIEKENVAVYLPKNAVYEDTSIGFKKNGDTILIGDETIPLHKNMTLSFNAEKFSKEDFSKLYVSELGNKNKPVYVNTLKKGNKIIGKTKYFGKFTLSLDTEKPIIKPHNTHNGKWMSTSAFLQMKISDKNTGIKKYRATINDHWILMEYDAKKNLLSYDFEDNIHQPGKNKFKLIVIDNVGNNSIFEMIFYRKN